MYTGETHTNVHKQKKCKYENDIPAGGNVIL